MGLVRITFDDTGAKAEHLETSGFVVTCSFCKVPKRIDATDLFDGLLKLGWGSSVDGTAIICPECLKTWK